MILNIGYFADGPWSHTTFNKLINDSEILISFVCVRHGSKDETLKDYAKYNNIDYLEHKNVNSEEFISILKKYKCNLFVSMSFNQIFRKEIINLPKYKIINCHAGKLPFYRGRNILNWALINDEKEFGITVHFVDEQIDTGDIILQRSYEISDLDTYKTLLERAYISCADILYDAILLFKTGQVKVKKQIEIHPEGSYCSQRKIGDEILNWDHSSRQIFNFVRAICSPGPVARTFINKKEMKIDKVKHSEKKLFNEYVFGVITNIDQEGFFVKTKDNFIKVIDYEYDGILKVGDRFDV